MNDEELTIGDIVRAVPTLQKLGSARMPVGTAYKIQRILSQVDKILEPYNKVREQVIKEFGKEQENGSWEIPEDKVEEFAERMRELDEQPAEIEGPLFPLSTFNGVELTPFEVGTIMWMLEE